VAQATANTAAAEHRLNDGDSAKWGPPDRETAKNDGHNERPSASFNGVTWTWPHIHKR
jgi:hypothetical protein